MPVIIKAPLTGQKFLIRQGKKAECIIFHLTYLTLISHKKPIISLIRCFSGIFGIVLFGENIFKRFYDGAHCKGLNTTEEELTYKSYIWSKSPGGRFPQRTGNSGSGGTVHGQR